MRESPTTTAELSYLPCGLLALIACSPVFHVTDQLGNKITDGGLILYIQQTICATKLGSKEVQACHGREVRPPHVSTDHMALEITVRDRPGLMSEISAVLVELGCHVTAAVAWTHSTRVACIVYVEDESQGGPIEDPNRLAHIRALLENVVEAHLRDGERRSVRLTIPTAGRTHTERRLHQLMSADGDYERRCSSSGSGKVYENGEGTTQVTIDHCKQRGYSVVNVRSRDRPKLLFDTVCTLTDMQYVVFHAAVSSKGSIAVQEYYIRHMDGCILDSEAERSRVAQDLIAAIERRVSPGLRLDVCTRDRPGLLSDITRAFREHGLSMVRAEVGTRGATAIGSFYVTDASGQEVNPATVEMVRQKIGGTVLVVNKSSGWSTQPSKSMSKNSTDVGETPRFSLGTLWSHLERFSRNFRPIKS